MDLIFGIYYKTPLRDTVLQKKIVQILTADGSFKYSINEFESLSLIQIGGQYADNVQSTTQPLCFTAGCIYNMPPFVYNNDRHKNTANLIRDAFVDKGPAVFKTIDGEFSCLIFDKETNTLHLANDLWGLFPLYYHDTDLYFAFSNMYEPLAAFPEVINDLDYDALDNYFNLGAVLGENTFFKKIKSLAPASYIEIKNKLVAIRQYASMQIAVQHQLNAEDAAAKTAILFKEAVQKRIRYHGDACEALLTGGADTRLILSCLTDEQRAALTFSTYTTPPLTSAEDEDAVIASELASFLKLKHLIKPFTFWEKPFGTSYFSEKRMRFGHLNLSGHFGSELFKSEMYKALGQRLSNFSNNNTLKPTIKVFKNEIAHLETSDIFERLAGFENKQKAFLFDTMCRGFFTYTWQGTRSIYFEQPAYMHHIFILPFLDSALLTFFFSLPDNLLGVTHDKLYNLLFKNHFPEFNHIPGNSPIAADEKSALKKFKKGPIPFAKRMYNYDEAFNSLKSDKDVRNKYDSNFIHQLSDVAWSDYRQCFIDFETWHKYIRNTCGM